MRVEKEKKRWKDGDVCCYSLPVVIAYCLLVVVVVGLRASKGSDESYKRWKELERRFKLGISVWTRLDYTTQSLDSPLRSGVPSFLLLFFTV